MQIEEYSLKIYDATGRLAKDFSVPTAYSLVPTSVTWDGGDNAGEKLPKGVYFLKFAVDSRLADGIESSLCFFFWLW